MAHIEEGNGSKNVSIELNLVPFIDLMSVCIIFLLITAVWTQVSMIQLGSSLHTQNKVIAKPISTYDDVPFKVHVLKTGFHIVIGEKNINIPLKYNKYNAQLLLQKVREIKLIYTEKQNAIVASGNAIKYENIILAMDILLNGGFSNVTISTEEIL